MVEQNSTTNEWADLIRETASEDEVRGIIEAINARTRAHRGKVNSVTVACCQLLGQTIASAPLSVTAEMKSAILAMIDGYAMQAALLIGDQNGQG